MECLRSFNIRINQAATFSAPDSKSWNIGSITYFSVEKVANSTFDIQGFKNIDLYQIDVTGYVQTQTGAALGNCIVNDWAFELFLDGQNPLVSGVVNPVPDFWSLDVDNNSAKSVRISKFNNSIKLTDPVKSLKKIDFARLLAVGEACTGPNPSLEWSLNFVFYYKYEGE